ncbi:hypothetical protein GZH46_02634, partial [Fragariocoptes setiger]
MTMQRITFLTVCWTALLAVPMMLLMSAVHVAQCQYLFTYEMGNNEAQPKSSSSQFDPNQFKIVTPSQLQASFPIAARPPQLGPPTNTLDAFDTHTHTDSDANINSLATAGQAALSPLSSPLSSLSSLSAPTQPLVSTHNNLEPSNQQQPHTAAQFQSNYRELSPTFDAATRSLHDSWQHQQQQQIQQLQQQQQQPQPQPQAQAQHQQFLAQYQPTQQHSNSVISVPGQQSSFQQQVQSQSQSQSQSQLQPQPQFQPQTQAQAQTQVAHRPIAPVSPPASWLSASSSPSSYLIQIPPRAPQQSVHLQQQQQQPQQQQQQQSASASAAAPLFNPNEALSEPANRPFGKQSSLPQYIGAQPGAQLSSAPFQSSLHSSSQSHSARVTFQDLLAPPQPTSAAAAPAAPTQTPINPFSRSLTANNNVNDNVPLVARAAPTLATAVQQSAEQALLAYRQQHLVQHNFVPSQLQHQQQAHYQQPDARFVARAQTSTSNSVQSAPVGTAGNAGVEFNDHHSALTTSRNFNLDNNNNQIDNSNNNAHALDGTNNNNNDQQALFDNQLQRQHLLLLQQQQQQQQQRKQRNQHQWLTSGNQQQSPSQLTSYEQQQLIAATTTTTTTTPKPRVSPHILESFLLQQRDQHDKHLQLLKYQLEVNKQRMAATAAAADDEASNIKRRETAGSSTSSVSRDAQRRADNVSSQEAYKRQRLEAERRAEAEREAAERREREKRQHEQMLLLKLQQREREKRAKAEAQQRQQQLQQQQAEVQSRVGHRNEQATAPVNRGGGERVRNNDHDNELVQDERRQASNQRRSSLSGVDRRSTSSSNGIRQHIPLYSGPGQYGLYRNASAEIDALLSSVPLPQAPSAGAVVATTQSQSQSQSQLQPMTTTTTTRSSESSVMFEAAHNENEVSTMSDLPFGVGYDESDRAATNNRHRHRHHSNVANTNVNADAGASAALISSHNGNRVVRVRVRQHYQPTSSSTTTTTTASPTSQYNSNDNDLDSFDLGALDGHDDIPRRPTSGTAHHRTASPFNHQAQSQSQQPQQPLVTLKNSRQAREEPKLNNPNIESSTHTNSNHNSGHFRATTTNEQRHQHQVNDKLSYHTNSPTPPLTRMAPAHLGLAPLPPDTDNDGIPGRAGVEYPVLASVPATSFACSRQPLNGYYADTETACQVVHLCGQGGTQSSILCPNGTIFNQEKFSCQWWYEVDCARAPMYYQLNDNLYGKVTNNSTTATATSTPSTARVRV